MYSKTAQFSALGLNGKMVFLRKHGKFLASRKYRSFDVHLYHCEGFYVEVWTRAITEHLCWIEVAKKDLIADNYLSNLDISALLDA